MPLVKCVKNGQNGCRWGKSGKCFTGPGAKKKAVKQGLAIEGPQKFAQKASHEEFDIAINMRKEVPLRDRFLLYDHRKEK